MTPSDIITAANQRFNSVGDSFFPDAEAYLVMYQGCMELAVKANAIEDSLTTTTVSGTQEYDFPTNTLAIRRVTYDSKRLSLIDSRQADSLALYNDLTTTTGTPAYWEEWEDVIKLWPTPDSAKTLKVYIYARPQEITSSSTLEIPVEYHMGLVDLLLSEKCAKNKDYDGANRYRDLWNQTVGLAISRMQKRKRASAFKVVTDVDTLPSTFLGMV
jgi:hypothetical protein